MLLFANKLGVHWYFRFSVKTADNIVKIQHFQRNVEQHKHIINCTACHVMILSKKNVT